MWKAGRRPIVVPAFLAASPHSLNIQVIAFFYEVPAVLTAEKSRASLTR